MPRCRCLRKIPVILSPILLAFGPDSAAAALAVVELPATVTVREGRMNLGELASVSAAELPVLRRLLNTGIGIAPRAGRTIILDRATLARRVQAWTGMQAGQIAWKGAASVELVSAGRSFAESGVTRAAEKCGLFASADREPASMTHEATLAVMRGQPAMLLVSDGAVVLERRVEVLQDAVVGQMTRVRLDSAGGAMAARVIAAGRVEAQP